MGIHITKFITENHLEVHILTIRINLRLTSADYEILVSEMDQLIPNGKIRILIELYQFCGWTAGVMWEETKFSSKSFSNIERIAVIGDKFWGRGTADFCKPFRAEIVRYYDSVTMVEARDWLLEGIIGPSQFSSH